MIQSLFNTSLTLQGLSVNLSDPNDKGLDPGQTASIAISSDIINQLPDDKTVAIAFTFYRDADLFSVRDNITNNKRTVVGSSVLSAQVSGIVAETKLSSPVRLFFVLNNASLPGPNETASRRCVFWDFNAAGKHILYCSMCYKTTITLICWI